jgi:hypothetical protein
MWSSCCAISGSAETGAPPGRGGSAVCRRPDAFFNDAQQMRLAQLMAGWRSAQRTGVPWPESERAELEALVEAELRASAARAAALADELRR